MNKFKKKTRSKMIAASIAILSSAAVVSTGFAAWVISGGKTEKTTVTITVDKVIESYHTIAFTSANTAAINFGAPEEDADITNPWLTNGTMGQESLSAKFEFTVEHVKADEESTPDQLFSSITLNAENGDSYNTAASADPNLVSALPVWKNNKAYDAAAPTYNSKTADKDYSGIYLVKGSSTETNDGKTVSFTLSIQFNWGKAFGYKNPFYFYNDGKKTASTDGSDAKTKLDRVAAIQNVAFTLTITTK